MRSMTSTHRPFSFANLAQILQQGDGRVIVARALRDDERLDLLPGGGLALRQGAQMAVTSRGLLALTTPALLGFSREEDLSPLFREYLGSGAQRTCRAQWQSG
jgi:hypothetical protein